jgi:Protein of unknown function (DUF1203)
MPTYRVIPIPGDAAAEVRRTLKAPRYGHPAHVEVAAGFGPCRSCLRTFREGAEERVLFTWDAFQGTDGGASPGPVFIHRDACEPWSGEGFPPELRPLSLVLEGYGAGRWMVAREPVRDGRLEEAAERLFAHAAVNYVHVRNAEAGCYVARVERGS